MSYFLTNQKNIYTTFLTGPLTVPLNYYKTISNNEQLTNKLYYIHGTRKRSFFLENGVDIGSLLQYDTVTYVFLLGTTYNTYPWGINPIVFQYANWIWSTAHANISSPGSTDGKFYWFYYSFYYSGEANTGKIHGICDNTGLMFFNNSSGIATGSWNQGINGVTTNANISIVKGINYIRVAAFNYGSGTTNVSGLNYTIYTGYYGETVNSTPIGSNDNLGFFTTAPLPPVQTSGSGIVNFTDINTSTGGYVPLDNTKSEYSVMWSGIFYSDYTGDWTFSITSDDASYMWIGSNANSGYTKENANIKNGGLHGMFKVTNSSISLISGQYYPIRIVFGENFGGDNCTVTCARPGLTETSDFTGRFFAPSSNGTGLMVAVYDAGGRNIANTNSNWTYSTTASPNNTIDNYSNSAGALPFNANAT